MTSKNAVLISAFTSAIFVLAIFAQSERHFSNQKTFESQIAHIKEQLNLSKGEIALLKIEQMDSTGVSSRMPASVSAESPEEEQKFFKECLADFDQKKFDEVLQKTADFKKKSPSSSLVPRVLLLEAEASFYADDLRRAMQSIHQLLEQFPEAEEAGLGLLRLAEIFSSRGEMEKSHDIRRTVAKNFPQLKLAESAELNSCEEFKKFPCLYFASEEKRLSSPGGLLINGTKGLSFQMKDRNNLELVQGTLKIKTAKTLFLSAGPVGFPITGSWTFERSQGKLLIENHSGKMHDSSAASKIHPGFSATIDLADGRISFPSPFRDHVGHEELNQAADNLKSNVTRQVATMDREMQLKGQKHSAKQADQKQMKEFFRRRVFLE